VKFEVLKMPLLLRCNPTPASCCESLSKVPSTIFAVSKNWFSYASRLVAGLSGRENQFVGRVLFLHAARSRAILTRMAKSSSKPIKSAQKPQKAYPKASLIVPEKRKAKSK
jgi:hypothetical protein